MSVTGTPGFRDGAFQSGCGMCKPSTDYTGGMPKRYFSPSSKLYKGGDSSPADISNMLNTTQSHQQKLKSLSTQNGGGSDWRASQNSRSLQPMEFQWTDMKDFQAFTKTPYISPKTLVGDIMPPSAEASTAPATGFDPRASDYGLVGGKKKRKTKKKTTKKTAKKTAKKTTKKTAKKTTKKKKMPLTKTKAYKAADKQEKKAKKDVAKLKKDLKKVEKKIKAAEKKKKAATKKRKSVAKK